jgi:hypothetical protein
LGTSAASAAVTDVEAVTSRIFVTVGRGRKTCRIEPFGEQGGQIFVEATDKNL